MGEIKVEIRRGTYYDSVVLMQLQASLATLPDVLNAGVMMGTSANKALLDQQHLLTAEVEAAVADDLIISIEGQTVAAVEAALAQVDTLLTRRSSSLQQSYRPKTLDAAARMMPGAQWVLVSVPGRYAAAVGREALRLNKHVFLYSDNVSLADELALKQAAVEKGLLVMGPDCGTAIVNGIGLGFANRVRRGSIGLVGASGTGLQQLSSRIHQLGSGLSQVLGTGGRDLSRDVGALMAEQALNLLRHDPDTRVIVLVSKPPAPEVADKLIRLARAAGKPVVINFIGYIPPAGPGEGGSVTFAASLDEAAEAAVRRAAGANTNGAVSEDQAAAEFAPGQRYLRGLYSGGTLAYEALLLLRPYLPTVYSNTPLSKTDALADPLVSQAHTVLDLGDDLFTVGRLHPMLDSTLRLQRLAQEAADPATAMILLDVVLGYGSHPNPASELGPAIKVAGDKAAQAGRHLEVVAIVVGTDEDPQNFETQVEQLQAAGVKVELSHRAAIRYVGERLQHLNGATATPAINPAMLREPLQALNVGLEIFAESITAQGGAVTHVDWRPPAGGNEQLMSILERMKSKS